MSHDIVTRCKHLPNGDFALTSAANNVTPQTFEAWTCEWYKVEFPDFTHEQREAAFVLCNYDAGTKFRPKRWRELCDAAIEYKASLPKGCEELDKTLFDLHPVQSREHWERWKAWYGDKEPPYKHYLLPTYEEYVEWRNRVNLLVVNGFIAFLKSRVIIKARIFLKEYTAWVVKVNKRRFKHSRDKYYAKVFSGTLASLQSIVDNIPDKYGAQVMELTDEANEEQETV